MAEGSQDHVRARYDAGFVVLSYVVSVVGCVTTLELLHRRTSRHGAYNWYLLVTSSITMGGIGIWCMHFIGNRAIRMAEGQPEMQIVYNTGFSAVSFFFPIVVLAGAFHLLGASGRINRYYVAIAGVLMGVAIGGMHYVGQLGISNYHCSYQPGHVVGAAVISIVASIAALSVFLKIREAWTDSWWKRVLCGVVLACSVSGMHWIATMGTLYRFRGVGSMPTDPLSRAQTVIVCTTLSCATCLLLLLVALIAGYQRKRSRDRAQQLVLACGYFDEAGRIMVTTEGALPIQKIANHYMDKTFCEQEFSRTHPAFIWAFRASYNWPTIKMLIPTMRDHLYAIRNAPLSYPDERRSTSDDSESCPDFSTVFKELFSLAALDLANQIHQPLEALGRLFEKPLDTGRQPRRKRALSMTGRLDVESNSTDPETALSPSFLGAGKFLFVTRQVNHAEIDQFGAAGFRFAPVAQILHSLSKSMELPAEELALRIQHMRTQIICHSLMPPGVHLVCFVLRPRLRQGFDVLVPAQTHNQLPTVTLPYEKLLVWQIEVLQRLDNWTVAQILEWLEGNEGLASQIEKDFRRDFLRALTCLVRNVDDPSFSQAKFSARLIEAPCRQDMTAPNTAEQRCFLLSIHMISTIYTLTPKPDFDFIPLRSFTVQQQVCMGAADQDAFAQQAFLEFGHCFPPGPSADTAGRSSRPSSSARTLRTMTRSTTTTNNSSLNSPWWWSKMSSRSEDGSPRGSSSTPEKSIPSGVIVVNNEITVKITDAEKSSARVSQRQDGGGEVGRAGCTSTAMAEPETFVDQLFAISRD